MSLSQQMTQNEADMSGRLTVTATAGNLDELRQLASDLAERPGMTSDGTITILPPPTPPPTEE